MSLSNYHRIQTST